MYDHTMFKSLFIKKRQNERERESVWPCGCEVRLWTERFRGGVPRVTLWCCRAGWCRARFSSNPTQAVRKRKFEG